MSLSATVVERGAVRVPGHLIARVTGTDPLGFLDDTTTQSVRGLDPQTGALTCYLDEKGRLLAELRVLASSDEGVVIDAEPAARDGIERLARIAGLAGCAIEFVDWGLTVVRGTDAARALDVALGEDEHAVVKHNGALIVRVRWGGDGIDILSPGPVSVDAAPMDVTALDAARIAGGRPRFGVDVQPGMLVNETPLFERAVSLPKGCFPGQESVARVHNMGQVRRRFVGVRIEGATPPAPCALDDDGEEVGTLTSAAGDRGIAVVASSVDLGTRLRAAGTPITVERAL